MAAAKAAPRAAVIRSRPGASRTKGAKTRKNKRTTKFIVRTRKGKAQG